MNYKLSRVAASAVITNGESKILLLKRSADSKIIPTTGHFPLEG
ncbi:MAG: hypothetical protein AAGA35_01675 [Patescibacteria group bacterium]